MTVGWVAATTRGRALARRAVGADRARLLVGLDWPEARQALASTVYGRHLAADASRRDARGAALEATAWQLRVLAGWLPPGQNSLARAFVAPLEIANVEDRLAYLAGEGDAGPAIGLGSLAVAWPQLARANSPETVREVLARSVWGDPGGTDRASVGLGMRLGWARRLAGLSPAAKRWAGGGAAVLMARERFSFERTVNEPNRRVADRLLGPHWRTATSVSELAQRLPDDAAWPLTGLDDPVELWLAEVALIRRVAADAKALAAAVNPSRTAVIGVMALLLVDLHTVCAVIELAGTGPNAVEVFDAVA